MHRLTSGFTWRIRALLVALAATLVFSHPVAAQQAKGGADKEVFHPTRILVKFKPGVQVVAQQTLLKKQGMKVRHEFKSVALRRLAVLDLDSVTAAAAVKSLPPQARAQRLQDRITALRATGQFEYVEPDFIRTLDATPSDSAFTDGTLWALRNLGQNNGVAGADIGAVTAWDTTTGSSDVIVAVIDTGIRYTHQDLVANMWHNPDETGGGKETNGIDDDGDGYTDNVYGINAITGSGDPMDDNGHGSHVAGTIGAAANDGHPHVGVAWNVRLMACKFLDAGGGASGDAYVSDEIECFDFAIAKGARIINASYGGYYYSQTEFEALRNLGDHGVLFVAAAGNDAWDNDSSFPHYPCSYDLQNIISVAAVDRSDNLADFSNYGQTGVDIAAPGVEISSCWTGSDTAYSTLRGTSMATPYVVGAAALVLSQFPSATVAELRRRILAGAVPIPALANKTVTGGRLNVANALAATSTGALNVEISPRSGSSVGAGTSATLCAVVTDIHAVTNATVTANITGLGVLTLVDNGTAPDALAADGVYTVAFTVPANLTSLEATLTVSAPGWPTATSLLSYPVVVPPPNDNFAVRIAIPASNSFVSMNGSNFNASKETGEPMHAGRPDGRSVWWKWTAPFTGPVKITTSGSSFDTLLAIYTGSTLSSLTSVGANDDAGGWDLFSSVRFTAAAGTEYQIAIDGYAAEQGGIVLGVFPLISSVTLPEALDLPELVVTDDAGTEPWLGQTGVTHDGTDAARSAPLDAYGQSVMETTVTGPGVLTFWSKVSSQENCDFLRFSVNGEEKSALSGEADWQQQTHWLGVGNNTLRWTFSKDRSTSSGVDAGYVDELAVELFAPAIPSKFGDLDCDGTPTVLDLTLLTGYLNDANSLLPEIAVFTDVNGDGLVNSTDISALADAILGRTTLRLVPDTDGDGIPDPLEALMGLDPTKPDSNNDGTPDGDEDFDFDAISNARENQLGTDPMKSDTDGDGWSDETELAVGSNPLDPRSRPHLMVVASPPVSLVLPANEGTGGLPLNTTVASPPVALLLPAHMGPEGLANNTVFASPPVSLLLPVNEGTGGQALGTTVAAPPVKLLLPADQGTGGLDLNTVIARPPVRIELDSP